MRWLKRWLYRHGYRPTRGSIFYSPSLEMYYLGTEMIEAMRRGIYTGDDQA